MIQSFEFEKKKSVPASEPLPAGGYVARIMKAEVIRYDWGEVLNIAFDIAEGEFKAFFTAQYNSSTYADKKWKGNFRLTIPQANNQYFDSQKRSFGNAIACLEESNPGYIWDWNESGLQGKIIGVLFRNKEWEYNGSRGWTTECCTVVSADDIRTGNFNMPKDKPLKNSNQQSESIPQDFSANFDDEDLPF